MTYLDKLADELHEIFDICSDYEELESHILKFVQDKSKESFKNGLETARKRKYPKRDQKVKEDK